MDKKEFDLEEKYLSSSIKLLEKKIIENEKLSKDFSLQLEKDNSEYLSEMRDMKLNNMNDDTVLELSFRQQNLSQIRENAENAKKEAQIFKLMLPNPFFAKISIIPNEEKLKENYYIGIHSLIDDNSYKIIDWRSPIAEVFYNFEVGDAEIKTKENSFACKLVNKRQFKIDNGELKYYFDADLTINDEILKDALGQSKNQHLKNIVQSIQKEQNKIIRLDEYKNLLINGVAGSGKTAIALHRIAYILYKLKGKITSNEILLISPNDAFSNYISTVLPDLSENDILKMQIDEMVKKAFNNKAQIESRAEQIERLIIKQGHIKDYKFKFSYEFLDKLIQFCEKIKNSFNAKNLCVNDKVIDDNTINSLYYDKFSHLNINSRIVYITDYIINENFYFITNQLKIKLLKQQIYKILYSMFKETNSIKLYSEFLNSIGLRLTLFNNKIKNEDAYPILLIKCLLHGFNPYLNIKHLVIDEVQDYSSIQLYLISMLFNCPKTFLGDSEQSIVSSVALENFNSINKIFPDEFLAIKLEKSYRPTVQIANLYNFVNKSKSSNAILREGDEPSFIKTDDEHLKAKILSSILKLKNKYNSIAILTKSNHQAVRVYNLLKNKDIQLISKNTDLIEKNICVLSAFNSKGLEFDAIICLVSDSDFKTECDEKLLFIMLSRALHNVTIIYNKKLPNCLISYLNELKK